MVEKAGLNKYIQFYGLMYGEELDDMYDKADMALGCFAAYKNNLSIISPLKSREALAKGLPFVTGCKIDICEKVPFPYIYEFPNDDSDIDMFAVEEFYNSITRNKSKGELAYEIREYAKNNIDMSVTMKPVIDYIEEKL